MARPKIVNEKNLKKAIEGSYGNLTTIAQRLRCSRQTLWNAMKQYDVKSLIQDERDTLVDVAENVVAEAIIKKRDVKVSMWLLEKKGNGYNPEITTPSDERTDNTLKIVFMEDERKNLNKGKSEEWVEEVVKAE